MTEPNNDINCSQCEEFCNMVNCTCENRSRCLANISYSEFDTILDNELGTTEPIERKTEVVNLNIEEPNLWLAH